MIVLMAFYDVDRYTIKANPTSTVNRKDSSLISNDPSLNNQRVLGLAGCGTHENSSIKRARVEAIQGWVTSLENFHPDNERQNRELLVGKAKNIGGNKRVIMAQKIKKTSSRMDENRHNNKADQKQNSGDCRVSRQPQETLSRSATGRGIRFLQLGEDFGRRLEAMGRDLGRDWSSRSPKRVI
ncbi:hypothetical protein E3N88_38960 [Mikania micrantha]|uniref:Uncharacterized protein n=1 Tax=Mikania micrantha TaxID=192012 RepID=A0A5N6LVE4_9ASTR|nr:hypothetical protein E3N88_38960 [Mikania micrantha]